MINSLTQAKEQLRQAGWDGLQPAIVILGEQQRLYLLGDDTSHQTQTTSWTISTGKNGFGNQENSGRTPTGLHHICALIGDNAPIGTIFSGRQPTGQIIIESDNPNDDFITTRILWLAGLEPGINQGAGVDTHARYIYIHGTPHTARLGEPVSAGCIRMESVHVIELFQRVKLETLVVITPPPT